MQDENSPWTARALLLPPGGSGTCQAARAPEKMTEAVPEDAFLACARAGLCHVKGMIAFLRGTVAESYPQRLILDVHGVGYEVIVPAVQFVIKRWS